MTSNSQGRKKLLFAAVMATIAVLVPLILLEGTVRVLGWKTPDDPYIHFGRFVSFFAEVEKNGVAHMQVKARALYREREVAFAKRKPVGTFRIFCIGSSASAGWPHPPQEIYSAYLERALKLAYPGRALEVINVSAHAYAAYRSRLILNEILPFEPDLIIIYAGNNEFLEPRRYATATRWYDPLSSLAENFIAYNVLRGGSTARKLFPESTFSSDERGNAAFEQWSRIEKLALALRTEPSQYEKVIEHYHFSISSMVQAAKGKGAKVILLTVPTNLRDWQPNVSVNTVQGEKHNAWREHYEAGRGALLRGDSKLSVAALTQATKLDAGHAATHYYRGRALEADGRLQDAYGSYDLARDLDANPFRAVSRFNEVIRRIGKTFENVTVVDAEAIFRAASHPYAPGFDLFLDYVHPTKSGNLIIAKSVYDAIVAGEALGPASAPFKHIAEVGKDGVTYDAAKDYSMQFALLALAIGMHQNETALNLATQLMADPEAFKQLSPERAQSVRAARAVFRDIVAVERKELLREVASAAEKASVHQRQTELFPMFFGNYSDYLRQKQR